LIEIGAPITDIRGRAVVQLVEAGRSRFRFPIMSLEFFINITLSAALWPWGWLRL